MNRRTRATLGACLFAAIIAGPARATASTAAPGPVTTVRLTPIGIVGNTHTYEAQVLDAAGESIAGATLDIGGLGDDPDLRATTTPMVATPADPTQYRASLVFPADGDWMLVVRVHTPTEKVELVTTKITGAGTRPSHHDLSANPSRRAVLRDDPTFFASNDLSNTPTGGVNTITDDSSQHSHGVVAAATRTTAVDPGVLAFSLLHGLGAIAWIAAVGGLVLANRIGPGEARNHIFGYIADRYTVLAGGGLLTVLISGLQLVQHASAGLTDPRSLLRSGTGTAYVAVFVFKMVLALASIVTSIRIGRLLPSPEQRVRAANLASVGAKADDGPPRQVLALGEANAMFAALIITSVTVLNQLHHVLQ